jgi:hypothetical protein
MNNRGQVVVVMAIVLMVALLLLALGVDGGRLYLARAELRRGAQAAADAGIGYVADAMVTLAVPRQTEAAGLPPCVPDGDFGADGGVCTATPEPAAIQHWLSDDDRATLAGPEVQATAQGIAANYANLNSIVPGEAGVEALDLDYPQHYEPEDERLTFSVTITRQMVILLAGLLDREWVQLQVEARSQIPQR